MRGKTSGEAAATRLGGAAGSHLSPGSHLRAAAPPRARLGRDKRQTLEICTQAPRHRSQPRGKGPGILLKLHKLLPPSQRQGRDGGHKEG